MQEDFSHDKTPQDSGSDFLHKMHTSQRNMLSSNAEFVEAFEIINRNPKRVTIFGSARDVEENQGDRDKAYELGKHLAQAGYAVVTGGGNGIMGAANKGAYDVGGESIGFNIKLPHEQNPNPYTTDEVTFRHFFTRKVALAFFAQAYVYFPGGFGTMDEFFEILTLVQTKKMPRLKLILVGKDFWQGLDIFVKSKMSPHKVISAGDEELYTIVDTVDEVMQIINSR